MLVQLLIKQFANGLSEKVSGEQIIIMALNTFTVAAQFACFAVSAVKIARNHSTAS